MEPKHGSWSPVSKLMVERVRVKRTGLVIFILAFITSLIFAILRVFPFERLPTESKQEAIVRLDEKKRLLEFFDRYGNTVALLAAAKLDLDKNFPSKESKSSFDSIRVDSVAMREDDCFFFPISRGYFCGANNCTWHLYSYKLGDPKPEVVIKNIFGNITKILSSLDKSKVAVLSYVHGGYCNNGVYLYLLHRKTGKFTKIDSLNLPDYSATQLDLVRWEDNNTLELRVLSFSCRSEDEQEEKSVQRTVVCSIDSKGLVDCTES